MKSARACWLLTYLLLSAASVQADQPADMPATQVVTPATPAAAPSTLPAVSSSPVTSAEPPPATADEKASAPSTEKPAADAKEVDLKADTMTVDVSSDTYHANGSVRVVQDGFTLSTDSIVYHRLDGNARAEGDILFERGEDTLKGDRFSLNLVTQQGELMNGALFVKKTNFRISSQRLEKTGDDDYRMERGTFTTCDGDKPSWRFEAKDVAITLDEYGTARHAVFYAGNVPILYMPYLVFPVKREKQSGLLIPKVGNSTKKGLFLDLPYYWVINPSQDVTFDLDLESKRGAGFGGDYRYIRSKGSEGRLQWYGIYDTQAEKFRGEIDQKHLELFTPNTTLASDLHLIADRAYYTDYGEISGDYNRQLLESTASFDHRWERYGLFGEVRYAQDLVAANNDATLQRLPSLGFVGAGQKLGPLFFSMDSGFVNFRRTEGGTGERLELHPRLTYYAKPASLLDLSLYAGYHQRFYNASDSQDRSAVQQIGEADAGGSVSLPLERVYDGHLRHLMIPSVEYGYVQAKGESNLPFFDFNDQVLGQSIATLSVANVLTRKYTQEAGLPEYRDLLYLKLSQAYQFSGERRDLLTLVDRNHHLADLMLESRITPLKDVSVALDGRYNPIDQNLSTGNVALEVKGEGTNMVHLGYRFSREELDYLEGRFTFPLTRQFSATLLGRYSFDRGAFLESRYAIEYRQQCWSVIVAFSDRPSNFNGPGNTLNLGNRELTVNFTLFGLGALGPMRAF